MFFCIEKETGRYIFTSNLKAISREFGVKYHKLYNVLRNGSTVAKIDGLKVYKGELLKGSQRVIKQE